MSSINGNRIAKNTIILYTRMIVVMAISLFTSRVFLEILGNENYGIYNVVGGIVGLLGFLINSFGTVTQRYLNTSIGKKDDILLRKVFSSCLTVHLIIAIICIIAGETIGIWFLNTQLNIPIERMYAAHWVFQLSIAGIALTLISMPYESAIISHEKISIYSYYSIIDVVLKLVILYILSLSNKDKLIIYALLLFLVNLLSKLFCITYSRIKFKECKIHIHLNTDLLKEISRFSFWMICSSLSLVLSIQGVTILMNIFGGPIANAARAIAVQVQSAVQGFVTNFTIAANPQMIQSYSSGKTDDAMNLAFNVSKLSFCLMSIIVTPIIFHMNYILNIWLISPPPLTNIFTSLLLIEISLKPLYEPIGLLVQASSKIKGFQIMVSGLFLLVFISTYISYSIGMPLYTTYAIGIIITIMGIISRAYYANKLIGFPFTHFIKSVFLRVIVFTSFISILYIINESIIPQETSFLNFILRVIILELIIIFLIWQICLSKENKQTLVQKLLLIKNKIVSKVRFI